MKILISALILTVTFGATWVSAGGYAYITAADLKARLEADSPMIIIDICPVGLFVRGHIRGAIGTNAYPAKTEEEKARLAMLLPTIKASTEDIIIVCPRGGGGAKNTVDFYKTNGIDENRMLILEKGMVNWPFQTEAK